jgi:hypothetical protein
VKVNVHEGGADEISSCIKDAAGLSMDTMFHRGDATVLDGDVQTRPSVGQIGISDNQIKGHDRVL